MGQIRVHSLAMTALVVSLIMAVVSPASAVSPVSISITVRDATTTNVIQGANVRVYNATVSPYTLLGSGLTDSTGLFIIALAPGLASVVTVNATGYKNYQTSYTVPSSSAGLTLSLTQNAVSVSVSQTGSAVNVYPTVDGILQGSPLPLTFSWLVS